MSVTISITPAVEALLAEHRIKFHRTRVNFVPDGGMQITFPEQMELEPYVGIFSGRMLASRIGAFTYTNALLNPRLAIGRYGSIAGGLQVLGSSHPIERVTTAPFSYNASAGHANYAAALADWGLDPTPQPPRIPKPTMVEIGHDVWIGEAVMLGRGIKVGTGAVLAARALVTRDVPPYHIVGGVPARTLRPRFDEAVIERLLASSWWRYAFPDLDGLDTSDPLGFCDGLSERVAAGRIKPFEPRPLTAKALVAAAIADGQPLKPLG